MHTTLNPYQPGVVRIHLVPAKYKPFKAEPSLVFLNGKDIIPLNLSWTILLSIFIKEVNSYKGNEITDEDISSDCLIYKIDFNKSSKSEKLHNYVCS